MRCIQTLGTAATEGNEALVQPLKTPCQVKIARLKRPRTHDSIWVKCPEWENPLRWKVDCHQGLGKREMEQTRMGLGFLWG